MKYCLEIIAYNIESCTIAQSAGANRIELCDNPGEGGTTPSYGFIKAARKILTIELYIMIRPRGGDFLYSDVEFEIMQTEVQLCKELGCDGIVIGMLLADGSVDKERCKKLVEAAYPMGVTFHRAFDRTSDPFKAMEDIIAIGCERILTSGQRSSALKGADKINALIAQAADRIIVMPGSEIRSGNIIQILKKTGAEEFHTSASTLRKSGMNFQNKKMNENLVSVVADGDEIRKIIELLKQQESIE